jgi:hypothetical protein
MAADKQREYKRAWGRVSAVLEKPADDPIWRDDEFWATRWPKLVDNAAQATENLAWGKCENNSRAPHFPC